MVLSSIPGQSLVERGKLLHSRLGCASPRPCLTSPRNSDWKKIFSASCCQLANYFVWHPTVTSSRILSEPDPFWRLPLWIEMFAHCFATGIFIHQFKNNIPWQNWAFVSLYLFTCLPWPAGIESKMIHELTLW